jgi:hypothetical protein
MSFFVCILKLYKQVYFDGYAQLCYKEVYIYRICIAKYCSQILALCFIFLRPWIEICGFSFPGNCWDGMSNWP